MRGVLVGSLLALVCGCPRNHLRSSDDEAPSFVMDAGLALDAGPIATRSDSGPLRFAPDAPALADVFLRPDTAMVHAAAHDAFVAVSDGGDGGPFGVFPTPCVEDLGGIGTRYRPTMPGERCGGRYSTDLDEDGGAMGACSGAMNGIRLLALDGHEIAFTLTILSSSPGAWVSVGEARRDVGVCGCELEETRLEPVPGDTVSWPAPWRTSYREILLRGRGVRVQIDACILPTEA